MPPPRRSAAQSAEFEGEGDYDSTPSGVDPFDLGGSTSYAEGDGEARRVGARSAFDSPGRSVIITRPLTPTGTHLASADGGSSGIAASGAGGDASQRAGASLKRQRTSDNGAGAEPKSARTDGNTAVTAPANGEKTSILRDRQVDAFSDAPFGLPAERGFPIQIGSELFRLSGASIMSDAPSYFSRFFEEQLRQPGNSSGAVKTLYIDRDPVTFQDIALHLQGYSVKPRDGMHYVRLFSDAQFYSLPKLIKQLFKSDICIRIGEREFQIPRDLFTSAGNNPNYFTLGFAMFGGDTGDIFPGLERENLFRPPSIDPPSLLSRSSETFAEVLDLLRGYPLKIRGAEHRQALLQDCRYYHFRGLEQALLPCTRTFDSSRGRWEIVMRLEDIRQSGLSFLEGDMDDFKHLPGYTNGSRPGIGAGWVQYARPFVDDGPAELIVELGPSSARLLLAKGQGRLVLLGAARARVTSLLNIVASRMGLAGASTLKPSKSSLGSGSAGTGTGGSTTAKDDTPGPASTVLADDDAVRAHIGCAAHAVLDGISLEGALDGNLGPMLDGKELRWALRRAHLRLCIRPRQNPSAAPGAMEAVFVLAKLEATSDEEKGRRAENRDREWVGGECHLLQTR